MIRIVVISAFGLLCSATALGAERSGFSGLPSFSFVGEQTGVGPTFDATASLNECVRQYDKQKSLVESLGYTVVDEVPCAIKTRIGAADAVVGEFKLLK